MKDPIVEEVRKAGEELAKKSNYNLKRMLQSLRDSEKKSGAKVITVSKKTKKGSIPTSEEWLYKDKKVLKSVKLGLKQAAKGKVTKLNLNEL